MSSHERLCPLTKAFDWIQAGSLGLLGPSLRGLSTCDREVKLFIMLSILISFCGELITKFRRQMTHIDLMNLSF